MSRRRTAYHEAAHAVLAVAHGIPIQYATIQPDSETENNGHVMPGVPRDAMPAPAVYQYLLGGGQAARIITPHDAYDGDEPDRQHARARIVRELRADGLRDTNENSDLVTWTLWKHEQATRAAVCANWPWITRVASDLLCRTELTGNEIARLRTGWD